MKHAIINFMTLIGLAGVVVHTAFWIFLGNAGIEPEIMPATAQIVSSQTSPDGANKAVTFLWLDGGGVFTYCKTYVSVVKSRVVDRFAWQRNYFVVKTGCDSENKLVWNSSREIDIDLDLRAGFVNTNLINIMGSSFDNDVTVRYNSK